MSNEINEQLQLFPYYFRNISLLNISKISVFNYGNDTKTHGFPQWDIYILCHTSAPYMHMQNNLSYKLGYT